MLSSHFGVQVDWTREVASLLQHVVVRFGVGGLHMHAGMSLFNQYTSARSWSMCTFVERLLKMPYTKANIHTLLPHHRVGRL